MVVELPYGRTPLRVDLGSRDVEVVCAAERPPPPPIDQLLDEALATAQVSLASGARVTVIISDPTRAEPRAAFLAALARRFPGVSWTVAVATGTHGPCDVTALGLAASPFGDAVPASLVAPIVNHDGHASRDLIELGTTGYGTRVRVHRCVVEADLVVLTGCIRPHYFAGFGAGAKAIFPGLGEATAIRFNHRLKTAAGSRAGIVDGNPCREDLEEAVRLVPTPKLLVNGVTAPDGQVHAVVAGDLERAFRAGCDLARPWFTVRARPAAVVIASDALPVTGSLYQASKIAAAVAPWVEPGGVLVVAAECGDGVGPLETVNEAILRIGILPRLPAGARIVLVSGLPKGVVDQTLVEYGADVVSSIGPTNRVVVVPRASQLLCEPWT
ncbi:MAG: lactate racemase domain-containing protein [Kofleriaceae bacterium]